MILGAPEAISVAQVSKQLGIDQEPLYQNANDEVRAIVSRYEGHRAGSWDDKMQRLQAHVAGMLQERWAEGSVEMNAREIWPLLTEALKALGHSVRRIEGAIAANDASVRTVG